MEKLLLVEDDPTLIRMLTSFLTTENFQITSVTGQKAAAEAMETERPDLALVDISLAEGNGFAVCANAKELGVPVIFLTASSDEFSVVTGLDMGADDYISKPFRPRELVSRIRSVLRRAGKRQSIITLGDLSVDTDKGTVTREGKEIYLSALDFSLEEGYVYTTLNVGEVIYEKPFFVRDSYGMRFIYPLSLAESVFEDFKAIDNSYYYMLCSDNHAESYTAVQTILSDNGFIAKNLQNIAELEESERNIVTIIRVFSYGFIVLISMIAAANVFNTISTNISLRRREFAMLKSVGMTQKAFNKMMNFECLLYGSRALLYGLPVSCGVTYLIYLAIMSGYEASFHLPWTAIGIATLSVFLVVFVTMMYSMSKIKKGNPIDALKNENF